MKILDIINLLDAERFDKNTANQLQSRKDMIASAGKMGMKVAMASLPIIAGLMPKMVAAQTSSVTDVLNFALTLEYLEDEFYRKALGTANLIPSSDLPIFQTISQHETAHVSFLKTALGTSAVAKPQFDFTANGKFSTVFSTYGTFLALAQAFEDTGVRAYKGQAPSLMTDKDVLTYALQIHSVEARHASEIRRLRGQKGWITGDTGASNNNVVETNGVYVRENNTTQAGVNVPSVSGVSSSAVAESFDEFLTMQEVNAIAGLFIA